jgi:mannose-1-phosphate guanylyltransferase
MNKSQRVTPVILSGGGGTRLWPLSRPDRPKQFLPLAEERTLLQVTAARVGDQARYAAPLLVANARHADAIDAQLAEIDCTPHAILLEPCARNTAPAIALAALAVAPDAVLLVMPSDHVIERPDALHAAVDAALPFAQEGWLITFGITPTHAETGYGYIKLAEPLDPHVHRVERFVEILLRASAFLEALEQFAPEVVAQARRALDGADRSGGRITPDEAAFAACPSDSIDYAVMEKADRVAVVPVDLGWSDVGSWDALYELGPRDDAGNVARGQVQLLETSGCLVRSDGARVSMLGVSDLIVVATGDEIMILPRGRSQEVKKLLG